MIPTPSFKNKCTKKNYFKMQGAALSDSYVYGFWTVLQVYFGPSPFIWFGFPVLVINQI